MTSGEPLRRRRRRSGSRRRKWRVSRFGLAVVAATLAIGLIAILSMSLSRLGAAEPRAAAAPRLISIQFNAPLGARFAGEIVAENAGFFRDANLQVSLSPGQGDDDAITAVVEGRALVGVVDPVSFLKARAGRLNRRIVWHYLLRPGHLEGAAFGRLFTNGANRVV